MPSSSQKAFPLIFRGLNLKLEPALLTDGAFRSAINVSSVLEGGLSPRRGSRRATPSGGYATINYGHSTHKMAIGSVDAANPRYIGDFGTISRVTGPYTTSADVTTGLSLGANDRWEAQTFNAGSSGKATSFFAHPTRSLRDDGTYNPLLPWGMPGHQRAAVAAPASPNLGGAVTPSAGASRFTTTITVVTQIFGNYYEVTVSSMAGIVPGILFTSSGVAVDAIVDTVSNDSFKAYFSGAPTVGMSLDSTSTNTFNASIVADGGSYHADYANAADWSFNGDANAGYDSDDLVHFGIYVENPAYVKEIRIRILAGSSDDYYEKSIAMSGVQDFANEDQTAVSVQLQYTPQITQGAYGNVDYPDLLSQRLQPVQFPPTNVGMWAEFDVAKSLFVPIGQAGNNPFSWKNISGFQVLVITNVVIGDPAFSVNVGQCYAAGGGGPDSSASTATGYKYVVTARNPETGEEGNPTPLMIDDAAVNVTKRNIVVQCPGVETDPTVGFPMGGNPNITGFGSLAIYRSGGIFADGLYRRVGLSSNPGRTVGVPNTVIFTDDQADSDIIDAPTAEFDNYGPVPSNLQSQFSATISSLTGPVNGRFFQLFPTGWTGPASLADFLTQGSYITVGSGDTQEQTVIGAVFSDHLTVWLQNDHVTGETVTCDFVVNMPCDVICQAGDSILLAGDPNNPHVVYRSKAGVPSSFPVINLETGNAHTQIIGSPDNPINGLVDYGGWYVSLNKENISTFQIWLGQFLNITRTPSIRGLLHKHVWCKVGNAIWFLSYDGIYAWSGSGSQKMTEDLDQLFKGINVLPFHAVDFDQLQYSHLDFFQNCVWFTYMDNIGDVFQIRYDMVYKRWEPVAYYEYVRAMSCFLVEQDTGRMVGVADTLYLLEEGTSDNDLTIDWNAVTGWFAPEGRTINKQFSELMVEIENPDDSVRVRIFYDYNVTADAIDDFTITAAVGRRFIPLPLQVSGGSSSGKEARVLGLWFIGLTSGSVTIYSVQLTYNILTDIQRGRVTDWTDLGYPHDKRLYQFWIDYDTYGATVVLYLDTIHGKNGNTITMAVQTFTLTGSGRAQVTIPIIDGVIVKKVRLRPATPNQDFEIFAWNFNGFEQYPADVSLFTPYSDCGWACEKIFRGYEVEINTGGVDCQIITEIDGVTKSTDIVNTTDADRNRMITMPTSITNPIMGKNARIRLTPQDTTGLAQLFKGPIWDFWREPCVRNYWDSGELTFGTQSFKVMKQVWVEYLCAGHINVSIYVSNNVLLHTENLPAHSGRDTERFFVPDAVGAVLNKSKVFRILIASATPTSGFKFYPQGSRVEWLDQSGDQRASYQQTAIAERTAPQA